MGYDPVEQVRDVEGLKRRKQGNGYLKGCMGGMA